MTLGALIVMIVGAGADVDAGKKKKKKKPKLPAVELTAVPSGDGWYCTMFEFAGLSVGMPCFRQEAKCQTFASDSRLADRGVSVTDCFYQAKAAAITNFSVLDDKVMASAHATFEACRTDRQRLVEAPDSYERISGCEAVGRVAPELELGDGAWCFTAGLPDSERNVNVCYRTSNACDQAMLTSDENGARIVEICGRAGVVYAYSRGADVFVSAERASCEWWLGGVGFDAACVAIDAE